MVVKHEIFFTPGGVKRMLHIWLPDDYPYTDERYPVMYFFDGHNLYSDSDATYGKCWGLADWLRSCPKPFIVCGIECGHGPDERLSEYSPYNLIGWRPDPIPGTGDATLRWMVEELKPWMDSRYRTLPFREATGIAGSSMGGLMSVYAALRYSGTFSKAACLSTAIAPGLQEDADRALLEPDTSVYLSWGTEEAGGMKAIAGNLFSDMARRNLRLEKALKAKGARTMIYCQEGGNHCEASWEEQIPVFMSFLWGL